MTLNRSYEQPGQRARLAQILKEHDREDSAKPDHYLSRLDRIDILDEAHKGFSCDGNGDGHEGIRVSLFGTDECEQCSGADDHGHDFCPVSEFCCGC